MKPKIGSYKFTVEYSACDFKGKAPLAYLIQLLLNSAGLHANERNFGYKNLVLQNKAWVLLRVGVYMDEYPRCEEIVQVDTWVETAERFFSRRCFEFVNEKGIVIGKAQSLWAAIDLETRKACNIFELGSCITDFLGADKSFSDKKMRKIGTVEEEPLFLHSPKYSDIDVNKHFNSVRYVERMLDVFDIEMFKTSFVKEFEIHYMAEALPETKLSFHKKTLSEQEFIVEIKEADTQNQVSKALVVFD